MKRLSGRILSVILALTLLLGSFATFAAAEQKDTGTACGGDCGYCPVILIPGNFQSPVYLYDDNGNKVESMALATGLYADFTAKDLMRYAVKLLPPFMATIALQRDMGLSKAVGDIVTQAFQKDFKDNEGNHIYDIRPTVYKQSMASYSAEEKQFIYNQFPLKGYSEIAGEDHLFFFSYDSLGSISALADDLYNYIQTVKEETGHDKVNLVPVSQGATIAGAMIERYRDEVAGDLHRIVLAVPALDGSYLLGKIFSSGFNKSDEFIYHDLFPFLLGDSAAAYALNLAVRLMPRSAVNNIFDSAVKAMEPVVVNSSCMWALTPASEYETLYQRYMTDGSREKVRREVEFLHTAQANIRDNLLYLQSTGIEIFDLVNYDGKFFPLFEGWEKYNADGIIQVDSTSAGAYSCPVSETLPDDYRQKNTYCTCGGNHISPSRTLDASAGYLCETTFYFQYGEHIGSAFNDVFIRLAIALLTDDTLTSVHSYPDRFPQFNTVRQGGFAMRDTVAKVRKEVDFESLNSKDREELTALLNECDAMLDSTVVDLEAYKSAGQRLDDILVRIGYMPAPEQPSRSQVRLTNFLHKLSERIYSLRGARK